LRLPPQSGCSAHSVIWPPAGTFAAGISTSHQPSGVRCGSLAVEARIVEPVTGWPCGSRTWTRTA